VQNGRVLVFGHYLVYESCQLDLVIYSEENWILSTTVNIDFCCNVHASQLFALCPSLRFMISASSHHT
jgi:hypothetical protein